MAPVVFAGFYPVDASNPAPFEKCIRALTLNDPSVDVQKDTSTLGNGYRLGFLGTIIQFLLINILEDHHIYSPVCCFSQITSA